jgi:transcriptional regulator GlxA family with amidase domain
VQNHRVEESAGLPAIVRPAVGEIRLQVGHEDAWFFRRVLRDRQGVESAEYRRMFQPFAVAADPN